MMPTPKIIIESTNHFLAGKIHDLKSPILKAEIAYANGTILTAKPKNKVGG